MVNSGRIPGTDGDRPSRIVGESGIRRHPILTRLIVLGMTIALGLGALEVGFRTFVDVTDIPFYFWDPTIGPRIAPNQSGIYRRGDHVNGRYWFNTQGWNHPEEYIVAKPLGTRRICLVGDSQVESIQVQPHETMYAVAERHMNASSDSTQWYAFGVSGFGTAEHYETIRRYVLDYHPDLVILLFVQNDPYDTSPYIRNLAPYTVRYVLDAEDNLAQVFPKPWAPVRWRRLAARFATVRYLMIQQGLQGRFHGGHGTKGIHGHPLRALVEGASGRIVPGLAQMPLEERRKMTWALIGALLKAIRDESERRGARFAVAFRGWAEEIDSPIAPEEIADIPREDDPYCLETRAREMGREKLAPIAASLDIPYLDLTGPLQSAVRKTGKSHRFPNDNHYSTVGHAAAGEALAAWAAEILEKGPVAAP